LGPGGEGEYIGGFGFGSPEQFGDAWVAAGGFGEPIPDGGPVGWVIAKLFTGYDLSVFLRLVMG